MSRSDQMVVARVSTPGWSERHPALKRLGLPERGALPTRLNKITGPDPRIKLDEALVRRLTKRDKPLGERESM